MITCTMIWSLCSISIITSCFKFNEHQPYTPVSFIPAPMQIPFRIFGLVVIWQKCWYIFQHAILTFFGWISGFDICDETHSSYECNLHFFCAWVLTVEKYKKANSLVGCQLLDWGCVNTESGESHWWFTDLTWTDRVEVAHSVKASILAFAKKATDRNVQTETSLRVHCR